MSGSLFSVSVLLLFICLDICFSHTLEQPHINQNGFDEIETKFATEFVKSILQTGIFGKNLEKNYPYIKEKLLHSIEIFVQIKDQPAFQAKSTTATFASSLADIISQEWNGVSNSEECVSAVEDSLRQAYKATTGLPNEELIQDVKSLLSRNIKLQELDYQLKTFDNANPKLKRNRLDPSNNPDYRNPNSMSSDYVVTGDKNIEYRYSGSEYLSDGYKQYGKPGYKNLDNGNTVYKNHFRQKKPSRKYKEQFSNVVTNKQYTRNLNPYISYQASFGNKIFHDDSDQFVIRPNKKEYLISKQEEKNGYIPVVKNQFSSTKMNKNFYREKETNQILLSDEEKRNINELLQFQSFQNTATNPNFNQNNPISPQKKLSNVENKIYNSDNRSRNLKNKKKMTDSQENDFNKQKDFFIGSTKEPYSSFSGEISSSEIKAPTVKKPIISPYFHKVDQGFNKKNYYPSTKNPNLRKSSNYHFSIPPTMTSATQKETNENYIVTPTQGHLPNTENYNPYSKQTYRQSYNKSIFLRPSFDEDYTHFCWDKILNETLKRGNVYIPSLYKTLVQSMLPESQAFDLDKFNLNLFRIFLIKKLDYLSLTHYEVFIQLMMEIILTAFDILRLSEEQSCFTNEFQYIGPEKYVNSFNDLLFMELPLIPVFV